MEVEFGTSTLRDRFGRPAKLLRTEDSWVRGTGLPAGGRWAPIARPPAHASATAFIATYAVMADSVAAITGCSEQEAASYLEMAGGSIEGAVSLYFDMQGGGGGGMMMGAGEPPAAGAPPQRSRETKYG